MTGSLPARRLLAPSLPAAGRGLPHRGSLRGRRSLAVLLLQLALLGGPAPTASGAAAVPRPGPERRPGRLDTLPPGAAPDPAAPRGQAAPDVAGLPLPLPGDWAVFQVEEQARTTEVTLRVISVTSSRDIELSVLTTGIGRWKERKLLIHRARWGWETLPDLLLTLTGQVPVLPRVSFGLRRAEQLSSGPLGLEPDEPRPGPGGEGSLLGALPAATASGAAPGTMEEGAGAASPLSGDLLASSSDREPAAAGARSAQAAGGAASAAELLPEAERRHSRGGGEREAGTMQQAQAEEGQAPPRLRLEAEWAGSDPTLGGIPRRQQVVALVQPGARLGGIVQALLEEKLGLPRTLLKVQTRILRLREGGRAAWPRESGRYRAR